MSITDTEDIQGHLSTNRATQTLSSHVRLSLLSLSFTVESSLEVPDEPCLGLQIVGFYKEKQLHRTPIFQLPFWDTASVVSSVSNTPFQPRHSLTCWRLNPECVHEALAKHSCLMDLYLSFSNSIALTGPRRIFHVHLWVFI